MSKTRKGYRASHRRSIAAGKRCLIGLTLFALIFANLLAVTGIAFAANPSADIDQCANDPAPSPNTNGCATNQNEWVNGNLGASKSFYKEGDSIPYRIKMDNLSLTPGHVITIEWDTTKSSKHALDYLTTFNYSVADANPCLGVSGCNPLLFDAFPIPSDSQVTGGGVTPVPGDFRMYGGDITGVSAYSGGAGFPTGDNSRSITITFTATVANPVLAWGGHIATRADWGSGNSAVAISGSPYHSRLLALDGAGGNQDRSLSADAVVFPASITIVKQTSPASDPQDFSFTTGGGSLTPSSFLLDTDPASTPTPASSQAYTGLTNFVSYTFTEAAVTHWTLSFNTPVCTVTSPNGGTQTGNVGTRTVTVNLNEGENVTCTFINTHTVSNPTITTQVKNDADDTNIANGGNVAIGTVAYDTSSLSGATSDAGGTVDYYVEKGDDQCTVAGATHLGQKAVASGSVPDSDTFTFTSAGTYYFWAVYSGDGNNNGATSGCSTEVVVVDKNQPTITTQVKNDADDTNIANGATVAIGTVAYDTASLSGATDDVSGDVTYYVELGDDQCTVADATSLGAKTITNNPTAVPDSNTFTFTAAGTYYFWAEYPGDGNNLDAKSACDSETVVVESPPSGQITPTGTTCNQFNTDTASDLDELQYTLRNGNINSVAPGVFFYWIKLTDVDAGSNTFTISQSVTPSYPHFFNQAAGSFVFNSGCTKVATQSISTSNGVTTVTFTAPSDGTYIIGVKYDSGSVKGFAPPSGGSAQYDFTTIGVPGSTDSIDLVPKHP